MEQETLVEHLPARALVVENLLLSWALTTTVSQDLTVLHGCLLLSILMIHCGMDEIAMYLGVHAVIPQTSHGSARSFLSQLFGGSCLWRSISIRWGSSCRPCSTLHTVNYEEIACDSKLDNVEWLRVPQWCSTCHLNLYIHFACVWSVLVAKLIFGDSSPLKSGVYLVLILAWFCKCGHSGLWTNYYSSSTHNWCFCGQITHMLVHSWIRNIQYEH